MQFVLILDEINSESQFYDQVLIPTSRIQTLRHINALFDESTILRVFF